MNIWESIIDSFTADPNQKEFFGAQLAFIGAQTNPNTIIFGDL